VTRSSAWWCVPEDAADGPVVQTADVGGRKISFAGAGQDGEVVLLIHGYGGNRNSWLSLQEPLAARHRVYALDLPGHGTSGKDVGDGSTGILAALHALLDRLLDGDGQHAGSAATLAAIGGALPVSVVWGRQDRIIPPEQAHAVAGAVRYVIEGAGHMPHLERPADVQRAIEETIARAG
jgi:pimeloyl-ACP methyl ester carboxylesterase